jgi:hypothetical protein
MIPSVTQARIKSIDDCDNGICVIEARSYCPHHAVKDVVEELTDED